MTTSAIDEERAGRLRGAGDAGEEPGEEERGRRAAARGVGAQSPRAASPRAPVHAKASGRSGVMAKRPTPISGADRDRESGEERRDATWRRPRVRRAPRPTAASVAASDVTRCAARGAGGAPAADGARDDADEPRMVEVRRLRVEGVRGVERLAVPEADVRAA